jgi:hypothetical protein
MPGPFLIAAAYWVTPGNDRDAWTSELSDDLQRGNVNAQKTGFIGGVQGGYNWQTGCTVFGIQADYGWSSINASVTENDTDTTACVVSARCGRAPASWWTTSCSMSPAAWLRGLQAPPFADRSQHSGTHLRTSATVNRFDHHDSVGSARSARTTDSVARRSWRSTDSSSRRCGFDRPPAAMPGGSSHWGSCVGIARMLLQIRCLASSTINMRCMYIRDIHT